MEQLTYAKRFGVDACIQSTTDLTRNRFFNALHFQPLVDA